MKKIMIFLVYLLICIFPLGLILRIKLLANVFVAPQDIIVFAIFLLLIIYYLGNKRSVPFGKFLLFQGLFLSVGLLSLLINTMFYHDINFGISALYAIRYVSYLSLIVVGPIFTNSKKIKKTIIFSGSLFLIIGFIQFIFFNDLRKFTYLGWDDHLYRLFSTLFDPNFAGIMYVIFFFIFIISPLKKTIKKSYAQIVLGFFTVIAIYVTYSRTALIALISGVVTLAILKKKTKILLFGMIALFVLLMTVSDTSIEGLNPLRTTSSSARIQSMREATSIIEKAPFIGIGFNAFRYAQVRLGIRNQIGIATSNSDAGTDNSILFVIATTGIIGGIFYILSYFFLIKKLMQEEKENVIYISMLVSLFIGSLFINALFYSPILTIIFLFLALRKKLN